MDGISILERIVAEEGSCCWARPTICASCPLGKLDRYDNGGFMSCVEALSIDGLNEEDADARYKQAAMDRLASMTLEKAIEAN